MTPVDILQTTVLVVRNVHTQLFFILFIPAGRNILCFQFSGDQHFFDLIPDHDMKMIGEFIGFRPDQGGFHFIYGFVKIFFGNAVEMLPEISCCTVG